MLNIVQTHIISTKVIPVFCRRNNSIFGVRHWPRAESRCVSWLLFLWCPQNDRLVDVSKSEEENRMWTTRSSLLQIDGNTSELSDMQ